MSLRSKLDLADEKLLVRADGVGRVLCSNGVEAFDAIHLNFENLELVITVTADTDEILISSSDASAVELPPDAVSCLCGYRGKAFGWYWSCLNSQGYEDSIMISFAGIEPSICFLAEAAQVGIYYLSKQAPLLPEKSE